MYIQLIFIKLYQMKCMNRKIAVKLFSLTNINDY